MPARTRAPQVFLQLGCKIKKVEVEDMIWEVDEDIDKCVSWSEFQQMYHRCRQDKVRARAARLGRAARAHARP